MWVWARVLVEVGTRAVGGWRLGAAAVSGGGGGGVGAGAGAVLVAGLFLYRRRLLRDPLCCGKDLFSFFSYYYGRLWCLIERRLHPVYASWPQMWMADSLWPLGDAGWVGGGSDSAALTCGCRLTCGCVEGVVVGQR